MRFLHAALRDFRNLEAAELSFGADFTLLVGANGQGKTNTLEALYMATALRPLRPVNRSALFRSGTARTELTLSVERESTALRHLIAVHLEGRSRQLLKDGKRCDARAFLGTAAAVAFTPDDLALAKGSPEARRRFLDRAILDTRPAYLDRALRFARALKDRNRVLAEQGRDSLLDAFDEVLATESATIVSARRQYVRALAPLAEEHFLRIATPAPPLGLRYAACLPEVDEGIEEPELRTLFLTRLRERRALDRRRKSTTLGPHHDDLEITVDGALAKERASQGQHRALVLALKLAELVHLDRCLEEPPVLLLDDMSSELDERRSTQLFEAVTALRAQVVLTATQEPPGLRGHLRDRGALRIYDVVGGALLPRDPA